MDEIGIPKSKINEPHYVKQVYNYKAQVRVLTNIFQNIFPELLADNSHFISSIICFQNIVCCKF